MADRNGCDFCCEHVGDEFYPKKGFLFHAGFWRQLDVDVFDEYETEEINFCPVCGRDMRGGERDG